MVQRILLAVVLVTVAVSGCSRRQPPQPAVVVPDTAGDGARLAAERERLRQDSIARAQAGTASEAERRAAEATARARAIIEEIVHFNYDDSAIRADAQESLARKVPILRANPNVQVRIAGHADERGSVEYNLALGMRRANAVRDYLAGFGIDVSRFETVSMGEDMPLDPRSNEQAWARNRRAEFTVIGGGATLVMPGS
jgi:peptidoglycan-associated lipoprotein